MKTTNPVTRPPRIALINDLTGFGRCSLTVQLPLISALKVQACPLPTAILAAHTGFPEHYMEDYTSHLRKHMDNWEHLGVQFEGIVSGYLGSPEQVEIVLEFMERFAQQDTLRIVDPVMGDGGKLYTAFDARLCDEMRKLLTASDVLTPNLTEACQLLEVAYPETMLTDDELIQLAAALADSGPRQVVITGISTEDTVRNLVYQTGANPCWIEARRIPQEYSGTGDAFVAIVAACLVRGLTLTEAVSKSSKFIERALAYTYAIGQPWNEGLCFEPYLTELT